MTERKVNAAGRARFMSGRMRAVEMCPYFARGLKRLVPFETGEVPTLAVDANWRLYWNSDFCAKQSVDEMAMELIHELSHVLRHHAKRRETIHAQPELWNIAGDGEINDDLQEMSRLLASHKGKQVSQVPHLPDFCVFPGKGQLHGMPTGWMAEQYYVRLRQEQSAQGGKGNKGQGGGSGSPGEGGSGGRKRPSANDPGSGGPSPSQPGQNAGGSDPSASGQVTGGGCGSGAGGKPTAAEDAAKSEADGAGVPGLSEVEAAHARKQVANDIIAASKSSSQRGTIPGGWRTWADEQVEPPRIPWQQRLQRRVRGAVAIVAGAILHKYTHPSRRQAGIGFGPGLPILPALKGVMPEVVVIADTSGSMGKPECHAVLRETKGILAATNCKLTFVAVDAEVHGVTEVHDWRKIAKLMKGGGGTDMRPAIKQVMERKPRPHVIVCITDGHIGDAGPEPRGTRFIWCTVGSSRNKNPAPWGEKIDCDEVVP